MIRRERERESEREEEEEEEEEEFLQEDLFHCHNAVVMMYMYMCVVHLYN